MRSRRLIFKILLSISFSLFLVSTSFSATISHTACTHKLFRKPVKKQPGWMPRLTGWGFWDITNMEGLAKADLMIPFSTGKKMPFIDIQGKGYTAYDSWTGSVGIGYRQLLANKRILGGYIFGDYNNFENRHFWVLNPGIESLGCKWDFRGNLYVPLSDKKWLDKEYWDTSGSYVTFTNHEQYNRLYRMYNEIGYGIDGEIGHKIPGVKGLKAFLGGYYFDLSEDIGGITGRVNYAISDYFAFDVRASYDDVERGTILAGIEVSLGGTYHTLRPVRMIERIEDPIERQFGVLNNGTSVSIGKDRDHVQTLERDHIWFFDGEKEDDGEGTYEDPFQSSQYMQGTIDYINGEDPEYAHLYFNKGIYDEGGEIELYNHQWMWGRTQNYVQAANKGERPVIQGSLILPGDNQIDSLLFRNIVMPCAGVQTRSLTFGDFDTGITVEGDHVLLNHVGVGILNNELGYRTGVEIKEGVKDVKVKESTIMGYHSGVPESSVKATGIYLGKESELEVENSDIKAQAEAYEENGDEMTVRSNGGNGNGVAYGIHAEGQGNTISVKGSDIYASGTTSVGEHGGNAYGILIGRNYNDDTLELSANTLSIEGSDIYAEGQGELGAEGGGNGTGVFVGAGFNDAGTLTISENTVTVKDSDLVGMGKSTSSTVDYYDYGNYEVGTGSGTGLFVGTGYNYYNGAVTISGNTWAIQGSDLIGEGNSTVEGGGQYGNEYSGAGNGTGLFIGSGHNFGSTSTVEILDDTLTVQESDLIGTGNSTAVGQYGNDYSEGNGTGLFVGTGYNDNGAVTISGNTWAIWGSDLIGEGNSTTGGEFVGNNYSSAGNGTGLFVGTGYNYYGNAEISDNSLTVQGSDLIGTGNSTAAVEGYGNELSGAGNGTGLFVGTEFNYGNGNAKIFSNSLTVQGSDLIGTGNSTAAVEDGYGNEYSGVGNGTGLFVGTGCNYNAVAVTISGNTLAIQSSSLTGMGRTISSGDTDSAVGNGIGLLMGMEYYDSGTVTVGSNTINVEEAEIYAKADDFSDHSMASGILIGKAMGNTITPTSNLLTVLRSHFDIDGGDTAKEGYGIWMQGTASTFGTLTQLLNAFLGVNVDNGNKIFKPTGTEGW
jgi:hypothetical protein